MPDVSQLQSMVLATDLLVGVCTCTVFLCLAQPVRQGPSPTPISGWRPAAILAGGLLVWGAAWTWVAPLATIRLGTAQGEVPSALPTLAMVLFLTMFLARLAALPAAQRFFAGADRRSLLALGPWRAIFGLTLLMIGLAGGLPAGFFWSAALGDMAVGIAAVALLARGREITDLQFRIWNGLGLFDLLHVLLLAAWQVRPFFEANPSLPPLNLIPLVGVPIFIAMHVGAIANLRARARDRSAGILLPTG